MIFSLQSALQLRGGFTDVLHRDTSYSRHSSPRHFLRLIWRALHVRFVVSLSDEHKSPLGEPERFGSSLPPLFSRLVIASVVWRKPGVLRRVSLVVQGQTLDDSDMQNQEFPPTPHLPSLPADQFCMFALSKLCSPSGSCACRSNASATSGQASSSPRRWL